MSILTSHHVQTEILRKKMLHICESFFVVGGIVEKRVTVGTHDFPLVFSNAEFSIVIHKMSTNGKWML